MAFKRITELQDIELVSLVDIVFLLLIFFLLTVTLEPGGRTDVAPAIIPPLEKMPKDPIKGAVDIDKYINSLIVQVEQGSLEEGTPLIAYFLEKDKEKEFSLFESAYSTAKGDSTLHAEIPGNFLTLLFRHKNIISQSSPPTDYVPPKIIDLVERKIRENRENGFIEIRAVENTEFGFINFLLNECSNNSIKYVSFRILSKEMRL